jgi:hypothetical protein
MTPRTGSSCGQVPRCFGLVGWVSWRMESSFARHVRRGAAPADRQGLPRTTISPRPRPPNLCKPLLLARRPRRWIREKATSMRTTVTTIVTLVVIWACYTAWPVYDLLILVRALDRHEIGTVMEYLEFGQIRASLTSQIVAAYVRRTEVQIIPRVQQLAALGFSIADPVVNKLISPEALTELLSEGGRTQSPARPIRARSELIVIRLGPFGRCSLPRSTVLRGSKQPRQSSCRYHSVFVSLFICGSGALAPCRDHPSRSDSECPR